MTSILQCPVCREPLLRTPGGYHCPNKHTFDAARQGYVNLLLVNQKNSREPGDNPDMIKSRRRFLDLGSYTRVSDGINDAVAGCLTGPGQTRSVTILDAGCGEGFYLKRLKESLMHHPGGPIQADHYGIDISKFAVRQAAQRDRTMNWFVASIIALPFAPSSLDIIVNVFAPADFAEFARTLTGTGRLVIASPGPRHLNGLREIIYPQAREHAQTEMPEQAKGIFSLVSATRVTYPLELKTNTEIMDLLAMTPYYWNIDLNTRNKVEALDRLSLDIDVKISVYQKTAGSISKS